MKYRIKRLKFVDDFVSTPIGDYSIDPLSIGYEVCLNGESIDGLTYLSMDGEEGAFKAAEQHYREKLETCLEVVE